jgi:uncharacterized protein (DUF427 family)
VRIVFGGQEIVSSDNALRILETSHPPTIYIPPADIAPGCLEPAQGGSFCEWKGMAVYHDVVGSGRSAHRAAWSYPDPAGPYEALRDHVAFYPAPMDACFIGDDRVTPQPGGFYGGWITPRVVGPFKGEPGTMGW